MIELLALLYTLSTAGLAIYGLLGLLTLALFWRHRHEVIEHPSTPFHLLPPVTVQLPLFNETAVVRSLLQAVTRLDYPRDRLQIQVIDDSTDETTAQARAYVQAYRSQSLNIALLHREHRQGYKAGALAEALRQATGEFIAIFDADFQPKPDFLLQTVPHFLKNDRLGAVQARWGHLNADASPLTAAQALALDKHFAIDQTTRHRARLFPKFNGSAGIWRKGCIEQSGNWKSDTLCEDLCLSVRAVLDGWELLFLPEVEAPAELPATILAYKSQQARWATGSTQCLLKYGRAILSDRRHTLLARIYTLLSMAAYSTHLLVILLLLLQVPLLYFEYDFSSWLLLFSFAGVGQPLLFILAQQLLHPDWLWRLRHLPTMILLAIGLAPSSARAVLQAIDNHPQVFVRTPKGTSITESSVLAGSTAGELLLGLYAVAGLSLAVNANNWGVASFLFMCALSFLSIAGQSVREALRAQDRHVLTSTFPPPTYLTGLEQANSYVNQFSQYKYKQNQFPY
jgi:cellulose synthase/poly-beta-1,6-N-acetylglucosamine synthase-like glycosyltransferase